MLIPEIVRQDCIEKVKALSQCSVTGLLLSRCYKHFLTGAIVDSCLKKPLYHALISEAIYIYWYAYIKRASVSFRTMGYAKVNIYT